MGHVYVMLEGGPAGLDASMVRHKVHKAGHVIWHDEKVPKKKQETMHLNVLI